MRVRLEIVEHLDEDEVIIRCRRADDSIQQLYRQIADYDTCAPFPFYKDQQQCYIPLQQVLFFETEGECVYAHTAKEAFLVKHRLYELEALLPSYFVRAAKSTILNTRQVYSITRHLTSSSLVQFTGSHKQVYVSRRYYSALRQQLNQRVKSSTKG